MSLQCKKKLLRAAPTSKKTKTQVLLRAPRLAGHPTAFMDMPVVVLWDPSRDVKTGFKRSAYMVKRKAQDMPHRQHGTNES